MSLPVRYRSHAKLNLYLEVCDRRPDGYHNIKTIFQTVSLADELTFADFADGIRLETDAEGLGAAEENLVYRAARLLQERGQTGRGARIGLRKQIPIAAGLAGGSGNAAAALIALNDLWGLGLSLEALSGLALALGSDVPYCLRGGTMAASGRGERLDPLLALGETWFVLVHPPFSIRSGALYHHPLLKRGAPVEEGKRSKGFDAALGLYRSGDLGRLLFNRLEFPALADHPELGVVKERLVEAGCEAALMSGSGPTVFGLCRSEGQARSAAGAFGDYATNVVCSVPGCVERLEGAISND